MGSIRESLCRKYKDLACALKDALFQLYSFDFAATCAYGASQRSQLSIFKADLPQ
ncbi:MAG: hypothetical protein IJU76_12510 [Desulfovibrionaceae bacterium]|nr:hypothetical protein [Desulfovibrionaceae bacterium]